MTTSLTEFLLARITEDEAAALAAMKAGAYPHLADTAAGEVLEMAENEGCADAGIAHFARHDPARVLAQCKAHRAIVGLADLADEEAALPIYLSALRALASVYADHPDFDPAWARVDTPTT